MSVANTYLTTKAYNDTINFCSILQNNAMSALVPKNNGHNGE